jgi:Leucine-rich repeat (LRR) protein
MTMMPETHLNLWKKHLGCVPREVWENTELETLVLADNDLEEISPEIGRLRRLRMLDLGHNRLQSQPEEIGDLERLADFSVCMTTS